MRKISIGVIGLITLLSTSSHILLAEDFKEEDLLLSLENEMQEVEKHASLSKQNIDYKPYIVTVLHHKNLTNLGIMNLREALKLVPGVDISVGMMGVTYPVFRGSNSYSMGQSQLYINGIAVNDAIFNAYYQYLDMPVDIIERIEVVRGPGSLLAHEHAYGGSINVITRTADPLNETLSTNIFTAIGENDYRFIGAQSLLKQGEWFIGADVYYQESDRHSFEGPDMFGHSREAYFNNENYALSLNVRNENWNIGGRFTSQITGPSYGQMFSLSQDKTDTLDIKTNIFYTNYTTSIASKTELKISAQYVDQHRKLQNKTIHDGESMMGNTFTNGRYFYVDYKERKLTGFIELQNNSFEYLNLIAGIKKIRTTNEQDEASMTAPDGMMMPMMYKSLLPNARYRNISTFYGEATYAPSEVASIAIGFKYDQISDHDNKLSPRASAVYMLNSNNILKLMATRSYKLPSWRDQYFFKVPQNESAVSTEDVDSYEFSYIYKNNNDDTFRFNVFHLKNSNQVEVHPVSKAFTKIYDSTINGAEFETKLSLGSSNKLSFNYSYADGTVDGSDDAIPNSAKEMATLTNVYRFNDKITTGTTIKYLGDKVRDSLDTREDLEGYTTWDQSVKYDNYNKGYSISLSVQNLLDEKYYLPAVIDTYVNDFTQPGRNVWLRFEKRWN